MEVKGSKGKKWLIKFSIDYRPEQEPIINKFLEFCRLHGYNRVAGIHTLMDRSDYNKNLNVLADKILDLNKEVVAIKEMLKEPVEEKEEIPATLGSG